MAQTIALEGIISCSVFHFHEDGLIFRFHELSHTFATHALASGVDVKTLSGILGHTRAAFTLDTYTHTTGDMQKRASEVVGDFLTDIFGKELRPWEESAKAARAQSG